MIDPYALADALAQHGRPKDFELQSYANWLPSCHPCNLQKGKTVFDPSLLIQLQLQQAATKASKAKELRDTRFDLADMRSRGYAYEKLDQLTMELLLGVR